MNGLKEISLALNTVLAESPIDTSFNTRPLIRPIFTSPIETLLPLASSTDFWIMALTFTGRTTVFRYTTAADTDIMIRMRIERMIFFIL